MKIEIISGSPRSKSVTRRVAKYLLGYLQQNTTHSVGVIDVKDNELPPIETVYTSIENAPAEFRDLATRIFEADAFILVSPEYNGSYSPSMKNLLDHFPKQHHKTFGIVTASPGAMGGMRAAVQMQQLIYALFGIGSPYMLVIPAVDKKFNSEGQLLEPAFENNIHNFVTEFLWLAERVVIRQPSSLKKAI